MSKSISLLIQIKHINVKKKENEKSCEGYATCTLTHSSQKNCRDMHISTYTMNSFQSSQYVAGRILHILGVIIANTSSKRKTMYDTEYDIT